MFTVKERETLRSELIEVARLDPRITGAAITGSGSAGNEDRWSDIDLAFGVREPSEVETTLADFSERMYGDHRALHHVDVPSGAWIYRVFLLPNTLQVDLAFAPAADFRARAPTFRLVFGTANELSHVAPPSAEELIGYAWLFALHVRSSIARGRFWRAEYMLSEMRDHVLMLACLRYGLSTREGRGIDKLPQDVKLPLQDALVRTLDAEELVRAFRVTRDGLVREMHSVDEGLTARLAPILHDLTEIKIDATSF
jgi:predicted nucleotidyltransferase